MDIDRDDNFPGPMRRMLDYVREVIEVRRTTRLNAARLSTRIDALLELSEWSYGSAPQESLNRVTTRR